MTDLGFELDLGPLFVKLQAGIDELNDHNRAMRRMRAAALRATTPVDFHCSGQAIVGAAPSPVTTRCIVPLQPGSPDQGHVWLVRAISIARGDADLTTTLGGTAWVFIGPPIVPANIVTLSPVGMRSAIASLPAASTWSSRQMVVKAEEYLSIVITGGTQNQQVYVDAVVEDYQEHASAGGFEL